jgi:hypothetical protein
MEGGNGRWIDSYLSVKCGEGCKTVIGTGIGIRMFLVINKLLDEIREVRLFNISGNIIRVDSVYYRRS